MKPIPTALMIFKYSRMLVFVRYRELEEDQGSMLAYWDVRRAFDATHSLVLMTLI